MKSSRADQRGAALTRLLRRGNRLTTQGTAASQRFSRWRLAIFLLGALTCVGLYQHAWFHGGNIALLLFVSIFLTTTWFHQRLKSRLRRLDLWIAIKKDLLARLQLNWSNMQVHTHHPPPHHPYALDLDLTGPHSLLALLDTTFSSNGHARLQDWIFQANNPEPDGIDWQTRQTYIKELTPLSRLRDRCRLATRLISPEPLDGTRILSLLQERIAIPNLSWLIIAATGLCAFTIILGLATLSTGMPNFWVLSLIMYVVLYFSLSGSIAPLFGRVLALHVELEKLVTVITTLEASSFSHQPTIRQQCNALLTQHTRPTTCLKQLSRICQGLSVKAHPLIHLALNAFIPWDLLYVGKLQRLITTMHDTLPTWLETIGQFDAASALAGFAYVNPDYQWPRLETSEKLDHQPGLTTEGLGHPLIPRSQRVPNDLDLRGEGHMVLVTGSNMSGKSTFLRTVGINVCLAQAGGPVCATRFSWSWLQLYCCIRVTDALDEGLSYFYAEVKRLKVILDAVHAINTYPVLFLIDEIYRGTNNRERLAGSEAFVQVLQKTRGLGMISTHDLELTQLADTNGHIRNAHFQESVEDGTLHFDYQLRPGPCPTTNALRIMAQEGLPVPKTSEK
jgi:hypothetical protein